MTRINRISGMRPPVAISRMPEQEIAFLKEEMRQRAELEEQNQQQQQQPPPEPPSPEEQAQRKAERVVVDGAAREATIRPQDPSAGPVLSISDLFQKAKNAGLHEDEIGHIQFRLKKLRGQERTQELRFLQNRVLTARNWAQALRTYSEISALFARYSERLTSQIVQSVISGIIERPSGKQKIPTAVLNHQEALEAALLIPQLTEQEFDQLRILLKNAAMRGGQKIRDADPEAERAFVLKAAVLRSHLFLSPDPLNKLRTIAGLPNEAMREIELFGSRIRGIPARDLIDFGNKPITLAAEEVTVAEAQIQINPKDYLSDGFFTQNGDLKVELLDTWSSTMATRIAEDGIDSTQMEEIVIQLAHVASEFEKYSQNDPNKKLDVPIVSALNMIFESENIVQCPSLWEIADSARKYLVDLRSLAALTLHLDAIKSKLP